MPLRPARLLSAAARGFVWLALLTALVLVWTLARQNRELARELTELRLGTMLPREGTPVLPFNAVTLTGDSVTVSAALDGDRQLLFIFNTRCPFCLQTLPAWAEIAERVRSTQSVQVLGVSLDSVGETRSYVEAHTMPYPVTTMPNSRTRDLWDIAVVPAVLVVDQEGVVRLAQSGLLSTPAAADSIVTAATRPEGISAVSGRTGRGTRP